MTKSPKPEELKCDTSVQRLFDRFDTGDYRSVKEISNRECQENDSHDDPCLILNC